MIGGRNSKKSPISCGNKNVFTSLSLQHLGAGGRSIKCKKGEIIKNLS